MNNYQPPSLSVYQEFSPRTVSTTTKQYAAVVAPHYGIFKGETVGEYTGSGITSAWPDESAVGGTLDLLNASVDLNSVNVFAEDAVMAYFNSTTAKAGMANGNVIKFTETLAGADRDAALGDRDVQVGDIVRVTQSTTVTWAEVIGLKAEATAASVGKVTPVGTASTTAKPTVAGTYTGKVNTTYIITVLQGGVQGTDVIRLAISDSQGIDGYPILEYQTSTGALAMGRYGLTCALAAAKTYVTGDVYTVACTAAGAGDVKSIYINKSLTAAADEVLSKVELGVQASIELDKSSYQATATELEVFSGISKVMNITGTESAHTILKADLQVSYRALLKTFVGTVGSVDPTAVSSVVGEPSVDNPLGAAVVAAATGGDTVYFTAVAEDTMEGYAEALRVLIPNQYVYSVVIASTDPAIQQYAASAVEAASSPTVANYKILWYGINAKQVAKIAPTDNGTMTAGSVAGASNKLQFNMTGFNLVTAGVKPGDEVRIGFNTDTSGAVVYQSYRIYTVDSEDTVTVLGTAVFPVAVRAEIHRTLSKDDITNDLVSQVTTTSRRSYAVYGDGVSIAGVQNAPGYVLAAASAGMRAGSYPQRPLSLMSYASASAAPTVNLTEDQLNTLAGRGVWIIASNDDGSVYNRHQLSTDMSSMETREQSYTTNFDEISLSNKAVFAALLGKSNISEGLLEIMGSRIVANLTTKTKNAPTEEIGPQLRGFSALSIQQDATLADHVYMDVEYNFNAPFNAGVIRQRVI